MNGYVGAFTIAPDNLGIWGIQTHNTANAEFTADESFSGEASIRMTTGSGEGAGAGGKAFVGTNAYNGQSLGSQTQFSYAAMVDVDSAHTGTNLNISINIMVDLNGSGTWDGIGVDDILVFEPLYGDLYTDADKGDWLVFSPFTEGLWWSVSRIIGQSGVVNTGVNYASWPDIMALDTSGTPNSDLLIAAPTERFGAINEWHTFGWQFQVGQKSGVSWSNFIGYLDEVRINNQSFDFELVIPETATPMDLPPVQGCIVAPPDGLSASNITDDTYCDILMRDGSVIKHPGAIPQGLIDNGVVLAVEIYRMQGGQSQRDFGVPAQICLAGTGRLIYMDNNAAPRVPVEIGSELVEGATCGVIPNPGTLVLISN